MVKFGFIWRQIGKQEDTKLLFSTERSRKRWRCIGTKALRTSIIAQNRAILPQLQPWTWTLPVHSEGNLYSRLWDVLFQLYALLSPKAFSFPSLYSIPQLKMENKVWVRSWNNFWRKKIQNLEKRFIVSHSPSALWIKWCRSFWDWKIQSKCNVYVPSPRGTLMLLMIQGLDNWRL